MDDTSFKRQLTSNQASRESTEEASRENGSNSTQQIEDITVFIEALLFVASGEVNPGQIAAALEVPVSEVERGLNELEKIYLQPGSGRGLRLQRYRGRYQLTTVSQAAAYVERFLGLETSTRLSRAALETLAIVFYRQPVTRPQIEAIRGVNSDGVVRSLLLRDLIQEVGRAEAPGRPILYSATPECLQYFGLSSLSELPPLNLEESSSNDPER